MKTIQDAALYRRIQLSALADGELRGEEFAEAMAWFEGDGPQADLTRATWRSLHVVGDVLRSDELSACQSDTAFLTRLQSALKQEARLEPAVMPSLNRSVDASPHVQPVPVESANEPVFRWKWAAGLASAAAVLAVSWNLVGGVALTSGAQMAKNAMPSTELALQASTVSSAVSQAAMAVSNDASGSGAGGAVMLRNPQLDAMIAAHSQLGGGSALQMPSGFLRNATFDAAPNRSINGVSR
ncbi:MAG: sigma-E factor negative regulatory protein [Burkholderiaceae bacterium]